MRPSRAAVAGGLMVAAGCAIAGWAWATESLLQARGKAQDPIDIAVAVVLVGAGFLLLLIGRRVSLADAVLGAIVLTVAGNVVMTLGDSGALDCTIGEEIAAPSPDLVRVTLPAHIVEAPVSLAENEDVRIVVVARHHKANEEEAVETTTYDASYMGPSGSALPSDHVVALERGDDDADVAAFLAAVADAEHISLFRALTQSPPTPVTCT